jgi:hypothetical protein
MSDPRDFERRAEMDRRLELERMGAASPWGWIAGAVFIIVILALVFAGGESSKTARNEASQPATTGMAPRAAPPAIPAPPPGTPSTTGQSGQQRGQ